MTGLTICDLDATASHLAFDLVDVLEAIGPKAMRSWWHGQTVEVNEFLGGRVPDLHGWFIGQLLWELSRDVQVVNGLFEGSTVKGAAPWIRIRAVDSTCFDVETEDEEVLEVLKGRFREIRDLESGEGGSH